MAIAFSTEDGEDDGQASSLRYRRLEPNLTISRISNRLFHLGSPPSREETERTAQVLFTQFYREIFTHEGVEITEEVIQSARFVN